jgi:beta-phosphoglucomutase
MIAAVIFDFDGVLADTERLHLRAYQTVFAGLGRTLEAEDYYARYLGFGTDREAVERFVEEQRLSISPAEVDGLVARKVNAYRALFSRGEALFPWTRDCVERLQPHFPLAIASGSLHAEVESIIRPSGLFESFGAIVGADDVARAKPAPDLYLEAARRLGVPPASAVALEDSIWGLEAARTAGLRTIAVTTSLPAAALRSRADSVVASLDEVTVESLGRM